MLLYFFVLHEPPTAELVRCRCSQVQNGAKVFAQRSGRGVKSQIGRWKGLDEDMSDDQVSGLAATRPCPELTS